jgi:hypothetical protein
VTKAQKKARIQNAVYGFVIPMRSIPQLYKMLEQAVESDWTDAEMKSIVAQFPGVEASS